ncbi:MAG: aminotransferase class I/II-fold pyridoxal phosphate-dependent enzyme [Candidatus Levyibacteriota bacterium]
MATEQNPGNGPDIFRTFKVIPSYTRRRELPSIRVQLYLSEGESPFGPPPEYDQIVKEIAQSGLHTEKGSHYENVNTLAAENFVRERFELDKTGLKKPYITFSAGGSDMILDKIMGLFKNNTQVHALGPHFPPLETYMDERNPSLEYISIEQPLREPPEKGLELAKQLTLDRERAFEMVQRDLTEEGAKPKENFSHTVFYICNPNTPLGTVIQPEAISDFVAFQEQHGNLVIIDEAFGDALPDKDSAAKLTNTHDNVIVLRTLSKLIGIPGERLGYAIMSSGVGNMYEGRRKSYDISGPQVELLNRIMDNKIISGHLQEIVPMVRAIKKPLIEGIKNAGFRVVQDGGGETVPIFTVQAYDEQLYDQLEYASVDVAPGKAFFSTHFDFYNNSLFRVRVPGTWHEAQELIRRMTLADISSRF